MQMSWKMITLIFGQMTNKLLEKLNKYSLQYDEFNKLFQEFKDSPQKLETELKVKFSQITTKSIYLEAMIYTLASLIEELNPDTYKELLSKGQYEYLYTIKNHLLKTLNIEDTSLPTDPQIEEALVKLRETLKPKT